MKTSAKQPALLALLLCIHSAAGLECMTCSGLSCSSQTPVNCSSGALCSSQLRMFDRSGGWMQKGCASPSLCAAAGSVTVSYSVGSRFSVLTTVCCDRDRCNANDPNPPPPGSLRCHSCDPDSFECTWNVTCSAVETCSRTIYRNWIGSARPFYGCVSENLCSDPGFSQRYLGFNSSVTCCNTEHCNSPELGLSCVSCSDGDCSSQTSVTCSGLSSMCFSNVHTVVHTEGNYTWTRKGCAVPYLCSAAGTRIVSYDTVYRTFVENLTCCDWDDCNAPDPHLLPPAGSLRCYRCDPYLRNCSANVTCSVLETCSKTTFPDAGYSVYGCVSENLCNDRELSSVYFDTREKLTCCNSSHCNDPLSATQATPSATQATPSATEATPSATVATPSATVATPTPVPGDDSCEVGWDSLFSGSRRLLPVVLLLSLLQLFTLF